MIDELARRQFLVARPHSFSVSRAETECQRLAELGSLLHLSKGFYALVPEPRREPGTKWVPSIEGTALGMAAAVHGLDCVALVGPSAARAHGCYPRALGTGFATSPSWLRERTTAAGQVRFVTRRFEKMDTVAIETDLGTGWATSPEQTALDLCRNRPDWKISEAARNEMIGLLTTRIDWELIDEIAQQTRGIKTLERLRRFHQDVT